MVDQCIGLEELTEDIPDDYERLRVLLYAKSSAAVALLGCLTRIGRALGEGSMRNSEGGP